MNEITLQLPNNIWEPLQAFAEKSGYSTEELIKQLLTKTVQNLVEKVDPIDEFIGAFCTNIPD